VYWVEDAGQPFLVQHLLLPLTQRLLCFQEVIKLLNNNTALVNLPLVIGSTPRLAYHSSMKAHKNTFMRVVTIQWTGLLDSHTFGFYTFWGYFCYIFANQMPPWDLLPTIKQIIMRTTVWSEWWMEFDSWWLKPWKERVDAMHNFVCIILQQSLYNTHTL